MELSFAAEGEGEPVVLLHGFTGNRTSWDDLAPSLADRFRVLRVELPGHGATPALQVPDESRLPAVGDALARLLDAEGAPRAHFVGYSMGGRALLNFVACHPQRVVSMAVLSASPGIEGEAARRARCAEDEALAERIERDGLKAFVERWMAQPLFASLKTADPASLAAERRRKLSGDAASFAAALRAMGPGWQPDLWSHLAELPIPALIMAGALDTKYVAIAERMVRELPAARLALIADAGHSILVERAGEVGDLLRDWLCEQAGSHG